MVAVNEFVRRQVKGSGKTYSSNLSFEEIALHAEERLSNNHFRQGYRNGVVLVEVSPKLVHHFICPLVKIDENTKLITKRVKRREGENPYLRIRALNGTPLPAGKVNLVLYRHDVLKENNEQSTTEEWELISINAIPEGIDKLPMGPITMMRNQMELPGGTKGQYTSEDWAESVEFWQNYAVLAPDESPEN